MIRKPYVLIADHEKDPVIRSVMPLNRCKIQYSEDQGVMMGLKYVFTVCTPHRGCIVQATNAKQLEEWLYAFDPLLAGSILSREGLKRR